MLLESEPQRATSISDECFLISRNTPMSPAAIAEMQPDLHHDQLQAVGEAFDALLLTVYRLTHRQNELLQHTENVYKEVNTYPSPPPCFRILVSYDEKI